MTETFCQWSGKLIYPTRRAAQTAMVRTDRRKPLNDNGRLNTYQCEACGGWHFGHTMTRVEARRVFRAEAGQ